MINPLGSVSSNNGTSKGAIPKIVGEKVKSKTPVMLRYLSINKRNLSPQKVESSLKKKRPMTIPC